MARSVNRCSVNTKDGDKVAAGANRGIAAYTNAFDPENASEGKQVINARKKANLANAKAKAKIKSKMQKASRKKNK